ncbi:amidohydrolase family protein, partial [Chloroflexota bacterium]
MKIIAIEEHFRTEAFLDYLRSRKDYPRIEVVEDENHNKAERLFNSPTNQQVLDSDVGRKMLDLGESRLKEMEQNGIDMQVLCLASGLEPFDAQEATALSKKINDEVSRITKKYPDKFAGYASLAPQDPAAAAKELERSVKELGLIGAKINTHVKGEYLDDAKYWVIFEMAEKLDVPIYIHPRAPSIDIMKPFLAYPVLAGSIWGYGVDCSLNAMRMICSGVFDKYPALKIILGHLGEGLPFWLWRIDNRWSREKVDSNPLARKLIKKPGQYFKDNFYVTMSGVLSNPSLLCAYQVLGAEKIMFAVDYPHEPNKEAVEFIKQIPVCDSDKEKICHLNAEKLLK